MFQATAATYGIPDLNSSIHGYVVFGNEGSKPSFNPLAAGMVPLSVMAIVCGNQIVSLVSLPRCLGSGTSMVGMVC